MDRKFKIYLSSIFTAMAVFLLIMTFFLPWYNICFSIESEEENYEARSDTYYYFDKSSSYKKTEYKGESDYDYVENDYTGSRETEKVYNNTKIIVIINIILTVLSSVAILGFLIGKISKNRLLVLLAFTIIITLLTPIYFYTAILEAIRKETAEDETFPQDLGKEMGNNFSGSYKEDYNNSELSDADFKSTWGGEKAWFLSFVPPILLGIASLIIFKFSEEER
ncbi:MAG: hypothetical protein ACOC7O_01830 [Thermoplasmatota archaeon]